MENNGAVWLASYPKSGNTWLRLLLEAYRRNGLLDINDVRVGSSDGGAQLIRAMSPIPLKDLGYRGQMLLRPAALLNHLCRMSKPMLMKTHFANIQPPGLPHCIPKEFTERAVYMVRDPRSVLLSFAKFFHFPMNLAVENMALKEFAIGGDEQYASELVSSWSNNVASWVAEKEFPVHVVKYEDMLADPVKEFTEVLEFIGETVEPELVKIAVDACDIARLSKTESEDGFKENPSKGGAFFNGGGSRWQDELGPKWIRQIEEDHGEVMRLLGYLDEADNLRRLPGCSDTRDN